MNTPVIAPDTVVTVSYVLFDGEFAGQLIELGRIDARARHDELCRFFEAPGEPR